ncbi:DNA-binding transcriptional regulator, LysR family [Fontibacillus panacisegetis]|uniref:DNA-binding transcriptional regulator, LysR family n=1 Tax=Fontibacillus panacisegetis TaxID=670482 RepID=A0A1G7EC15_9BACL|nr:LysR family transcriptional regulator [Fontibacillus panacisegetis]SDE61203.1 DNA-binding transcriptional regulator, LysR family [Fontibacillus panacisegetis]
MEWQQLEYFQTVARMEHMTRAAHALSISQSALSRSISRMEEELGVPLFDRQGRSIILNRYGQLFVKRVHRMIKELEEGQAELQSLIDGEAGEVTLGFLHTLGSNVIPDLIVNFREICPNIRFQLNQNNTLSLQEQLIQGSVDMCLLSYPNEHVHLMEWRELKSEELYVFVPLHHRLANRSSIDLSEIAGEPMISFKNGFGLRNLIDYYCMAAGFTPKIAFEGEEVPTIEALVAAGLGVAILPGVKGINNHQIVRLKVTSPQCRRVIGIAWMKERYMSPPTKRFLEFVIHYFKR